MHLDEPPIRAVRNGYIKDDPVHSLMTTVVYRVQKRIASEIQQIRKRQKNDQELFAQGHLRRIGLTSAKAVSTAVAMTRRMARLVDRRVIVIIVKYPATPVGHEEAGEESVRTRRQATL